jgi:hypothetical protein
VTGGGEHRHVHPNLGDHHPSSDFSDPRDRDQVAELPVERDGAVLDPGVDRREVLVELIDVVQVHPQENRVVVAEPAAQRQGELVDLGPHTSLGELREHLGGAFAGVSGCLCKRSSLV